MCKIDGFMEIQYNKRETTTNMVGDLPRYERYDTTLMKLTIYHC